MEDYEAMASDAHDAYNAFDATAIETQGSNENEALHQGIEVELEEDNVLNVGVLKATSGNVSKRLGTRQETRMATRASKNGATAIQQMATQERHVEKLRMQEWKRKVMTEVAHELQVMKSAQTEVMEAQQQSFEKELGRLREKLELCEAKANILTDEIHALKSKGARLAQNLPAAKKKPAAKNVQTTSDIEQTDEQVDEQTDEQAKRSGNQGTSAEDGRGTPSQNQVRRARASREPTQNPVEENATPSPTYQGNQNGQRSYAAVASAKPIQNPSQPWTKVNYGSRRNGTHKPATEIKVEQRGRRILFPRKNGNQLKSEADLMLALNEALQKAGVEAKVRFSRIRYAPSGSISALLTEKADATMLIPSRSNLLIRAAKSVDDAVVGVEVLEQWQRLKVHGMPLDRYLGFGKMELLKREVESSTGVSLKATPRWLISKDRLEEQQATNNKRGSAIVITVSNEYVAKKFIASGLRFGGAVKKVEKFWEAGPGSVCLRCCGIGHERLEKCGNRPEKCVMCAGEHQISGHQCGVSGCSKGIGKLCVHVVARCANCNGNHQANSARCPSRHKAETQARKKKCTEEVTPLAFKSKDDKANDEASSNPASPGSDKVNPDSDIGMDLEPENWAVNEEEYSSDQDEIPEGIDYTKDF